MEQRLCYFAQWMELNNNRFFSLSVNHRVYRLQGFLSSRQNGTPPRRPLTRRWVLPPPLCSREGGTHSLAGEGAGGANSDVETDTLVFKVKYNPSTK
jgi:hypothetical protein